MQHLFSGQPEYLNNPRRPESSDSRIQKLEETIQSLEAALSKKKSGIPSSTRRKWRQQKKEAKQELQALLAEQTPRRSQTFNIPSSKQPVVRQGPVSTNEKPQGTSTMPAPHPDSGEPIILTSASTDQQQPVASAQDPVTEFVESTPGDQTAIDTQDVSTGTPAGRPWYKNRMVWLAGGGLALGVTAWLLLRD